MPDTRISLQQNSSSRRRGRPESPDKLFFHSIGLRRSDWEWLVLWFPEANQTAQLSALFERVRKFWPNGPFEPPRCPRCGRFVASLAAVCSCYANSAAEEWGNGVVPLVSRHGE